MPRSWALCLSGWPPVLSPPHTDPRGIRGRGALVQVTRVQADRTWSVHVSSQVPGRGAQTGDLSSTEWKPSIPAAMGTPMTRYGRAPRAGCSVCHRPLGSALHLPGTRGAGAWRPRGWTSEHPASPGTRAAPRPRTHSHKCSAANWLPV